VFSVKKKRNNGMMEWWNNGMMRKMARRGARGREQGE